MNEIFGIPMNGIMVVLLVLLVVCLLSVAWVAWRRPVIFKLGMRNIPRRRTQTILIVIGLMLSTLIIAAALGTGDTIDWSATSATYDQLGEVDELVVYSRSDENEGNVGNAIEETIPESTVDQVEAAFPETGDDRLIDGVMPVLIESVPVFLVEVGPDGQPVIENGQPKAEQAEPFSYLIGIDPARLGEIGGLDTVDGDPVDFNALQPFQVSVGGVTLTGSEVVISETMADDLGAEVGDVLAVFHNNLPIPLKVVSVAEDSPLSGRFDPTTPGMTITLSSLQALTGQEEQITLVAVSNRGGVRDGMDLTDQVVDRLQEAFVGQDLGVDPVKQESIEMAQLFSNIFTGLFLVLGLFSIAVGILLIILIFTMLAAERRSEMGMTRAIGGHRRQLIQQFVSEGSGYAIVAGLVGAALGVLATYLIGWAFGAIFGEFFPIEPHVTLRSLVVAYCLGVVITFIAVVGSSWRISRLNVVAAIRDIPEVSSPQRKVRTLVYAGLMIGFGLLFILIGQTGSFGRAFFFYAGMSLVPFGVALFFRYFGVHPRLVFSLVGIYILILWFLPPKQSEALFGDLGGGFEMFFLSGIFMVAGATILIVQNLDLLLAGLNLLGGLFGRKLAAVRTAISYPGAARGRTGMTIAMFSLIVFSLVTFATINDNFVNLFLGDDANAGWDVRADLVSSNPIGDGSAAAFDQALVEASTDPDLDPEQQAAIAPGQFTATGVVTTTFQGQLRQPGETEWKIYGVHGMDDNFLGDSRIFFQQRAAGYDSDDAILEALATRDDVAVIDQAALFVSGGFGQDPNAFVFDDPDGDGPQEPLESGDDPFAPRPVEIEGANGQVTTLTIIGIIDSKVGSLFGLYARQDIVGAIYPDPTMTSYYLRSADPDAADEQAKAIEEALLQNGLQAVSIRDELKDFQRQNQGFLYIIQGFMGLGLVVGIAAVGVIAFRAVVERRQQIGMLRALGYQRDMVSLSFLIETAFVVGIGVISGTALAIPLAYILMTSDDFAGPDINFVVPWPLVIAILAITILAALLMTWVPSRQAARLAPAEALRYE